MKRRTQALALAMACSFCAGPSFASLETQTSAPQAKPLPDDGAYLVARGGARGGGGAARGGGGARGGGARGGGGGYAGGAAQSRGVRSGASSSIDHNVSGNRNFSRNTNVNRNTNINVNNNFNGGWDNHYNHPIAAAAAITATVAVTAAAVGSIVYTVPPSCGSINVHGMGYYQCGSTWYQPQYAGTSVQYVVVNPPQ